VENLENHRPGIRFGPTKKKELKGTVVKRKHKHWRKKHFPHFREKDKRQLGTHHSPDKDTQLESEKDRLIGPKHNWPAKKT